MVSPLRDAIVDKLHAHLNKVLTAAAIGDSEQGSVSSVPHFALDEFGNQGFLPELDALLQQHGQERNGQAKTAGKGVPR